MKNNKALIPVAALVVFGTITLSSLEREQKLPGGDQVIGFGIAFFILSALADLGLPVAGGMAVLVMVATLLSRGVEALEFISGSITKQHNVRLKTQKMERKRAGSKPGFETATA